MGPQIFGYTGSPLAVKANGHRDSSMGQAWAANGRLFPDHHLIGVDRVTDCFQGSDGPSPYQVRGRLSPGMDSRFRGKDGGGGLGCSDLGLGAARIHGSPGTRRAAGGGCALRVARISANVRTTESTTTTGGCPERSLPAPVRCDTCPGPRLGATAEGHGRQCLPAASLRPPEVGRARGSGIGNASRYPAMRC